jgi:hypothetical protein
MLGAAECSVHIEERPSEHHVCASKDSKDF